MSDFASRWSGALLDTYPAPPVELVSGSGATVTDAEGAEYIDMLAGIAVNALGHAHPAVVEAVSSQVATLGHVSNLFGSRPVVEVAEALRARVGDDTARVFFSNSGAEANEAAFKLARLTGRRRILAAERGFHGRTMGSLALTGQPDKQAPFVPLPAGVEFYPYGDIRALEDLVQQDPGNTAAIVLEPIQGEAGVWPASDAFLQELRALTQQRGLLLIVDEIQTGIGRTGKLFGHEHAGIAPDIMTLGKGIGGGVPLAALLATEHASCFDHGDQGGTFNGNPLMCAAGLVVLDQIGKPDFLKSVTDTGLLLERELQRLSARHGLGEIRGRGLLLALDLKMPIGAAVMAEALAAGVLVNSPQPDTLRFMPALNVTREEIALMIDCLDTVLTKVGAARRVA